MATVEPEVILNELEGFCHDGPALDTFYRELLERAPPPPATPPPPPTNRGMFGPAGNVPEASIPSLGLPPGVLLTPGAAAAAAAAAREEYLGGWAGGLGLAGSVGSSRVGSPAVGGTAPPPHPSQLALRRGSVQDGLLGLRMPGHGADRREG